MNDFSFDISSFISTGDVLLIVPPFAKTKRPSLGVHTLQACANKEEVKVSVFYANMAFAAYCGLKDYWAICGAPDPFLVGERIFANVAYGVPPLGHNSSKVFKACIGNKSKDIQEKESFIKIELSQEILIKIEKEVQKWITGIAKAIISQGFKIVGCSSMFEQTAASVALLSTIKQLQPEIITIMGGPNCEGEMAEGIASLSSDIDYIFSGESERTFIAFLQQYFDGQTPSERIIYGQPLQDLDSLPTPSFDEYYTQFQHYLPKEMSRFGSIELMYETSRGCWWGQKHHCTFCGLNGEGMGFREKSPEKVVSQLRTLLANHPNRAKLIMMSDNIMPYTFFKTVVPKLAELAAEVPGLRIFYEQKANLSLEQVIALVKAGITHILPGIESLSTTLLKRMDKGTTAGQNIALLRYARSAGLTLTWNLLNSFPGDQLREYEETLAVMPLLHHLQPPIAFFQLRIDRFSPYFERPQNYGVTNIQPADGFKDVLPEDIDKAKVAPHFTADYECDASDNIDILIKIATEITRWRAKWDNIKTIKLFFGKVKTKEEPILEVTEGDDGQFLLRDTRGLTDTQTSYILNEDLAMTALVPKRYRPSPATDWAIAHKIAVVLDDIYYVPLATAQPDLLLAFEQKNKKSKLPTQEIIPLMAV